MAGSAPVAAQALRLLAQQPGQELRPRALHRDAADLDLGGVPLVADEPRGQPRFR